MKITASEGARLVGIASRVAGVAEVHEMKTEGDVMKMRAVPALELPAGCAVELKPGGYHVMLMDLKQPLPVGSTVPVTLMFRDGKGVESRLELKLPVASSAAGAATGSRAGRKAWQGWPRRPCPLRVWYSAGLAAKPPVHGCAADAERARCFHDVSVGVADRFAYQRGFDFLERNCRCG